LFIELIELLRCTGPHDESWLVAALDRTDGRVVLEGRLGCHVCGAQFPITGGVAIFGVPPSTAAVSDSGDEPDAGRIAALLGLDSASGVVLLEGKAAAVADPLLEMLPVAVLVVNPPSPMPPRERFGVVNADLGLPIRTGVAAGAAIAGGLAAVADAPRVLVAGARLLAPVGAPLPEELEELARDEREWVAVKRGTGKAIQLTRR
jgi:uncharacterized protein YbaR (Trm112 family)